MLYRLCFLLGFWIGSTASLYADYCGYYATKFLLEQNGENIDDLERTLEALSQQKVASLADLRHAIEQFGYVVECYEVTDSLLGIYSRPSAMNIVV